MREGLFDICTLIMTVLMLSVSATFFLSFLSPVRFSYQIGTVPPGVLKALSCDHGITTSSRIFSQGSNTVVSAKEMAVTSLSKFNLTIDDLTKFTNAGIMVNTSLSVSLAIGSPRGSTKTRLHYDVRFNPSTLNQIQFGNYSKAGSYYVYAVNFRDSGFTSAVFQSNEPIKWDDVDVDTYMLISVQQMTGSDTSFALGDEISDSTRLINSQTVDCWIYREFDFNDTAFKLNIVTAAVASLCFLIQLEFFGVKYCCSRKQENQIATRV
jgi:hypothetical protein